MTTKLTFTTLAAAGLATVALGLASPAFAAPSGVDGNNGNDGRGTISAPYGDFDYPMGIQTPYGTYQHAHKAGPNSR